MSEEYVVAMPFKAKHLHYPKDQIDGRYVTDPDAFTKWVRKSGKAFYHDQPPRLLRGTTTRIVFAWADGQNPWVACGETEVSRRRAKRGNPEPDLRWSIGGKSVVAWKPTPLPRRTRQGQRQVPLSAKEYRALRAEGLR